MCKEEEYQLPVWKIGHKGKIQSLVIFPLYQTGYNQSIKNIT